MFVTCDINPMIQNVEVEIAFRRLNLLPGYWDEGSIDVHLRESRKNLVCLRGGAGRRVSYFAPSNKIRFAIDDQLASPATLDDLRGLRLRGV